MRSRAGTTAASIDDGVDIHPGALHDAGVALQYTRPSPSRSIAHAIACIATARIGRLAKLQVITMGANGGVTLAPDGSKLSGITGTIPMEFANLPGLVELDLQARGRARMAS